MQWIKRAEKSNPGPLFLVTIYLIKLHICHFLAPEEVGNRMALWPNGKASLSGGEDCGFESHRRRIIVKFLDFFFPLEGLRRNGKRVTIMDSASISRY
jgi:hypothetical protein